MGGGWVGGLDPRLIKMNAKFDLLFQNSGFHTHTRSQSRCRALKNEQEDVERFFIFFF